LAIDNNLQNYKSLNKSCTVIATRDAAYTSIVIVDQLFGLQLGMQVFRLYQINVLVTSERLGWH